MVAFMPGGLEAVKARIIELESWKNKCLTK
jgi:hypothetical protein